MKKLILLPALIALVCTTASAQNIFETLRYSTYNYGTTARALGSGAAMGALGADLSVTSSNPAGIAEFRKSSFTLTGDFSFSNTDATLVGANLENETGFTSNLEQIGAVFFKAPLASKWKTSNFAINFNRLGSFDEDISYQGVTRGTITERFVERANFLSPDELGAFEAGPAFDAGAIYDFDGDNIYETDFRSFEELVFKGQEIARRGGLSELSLAYAANYNNKLSLGGSVGIPLVNFQETKRYFELDSEGDIEFFDELQFEEILQTAGVGLNLKLGLLYKITPKIRLGAAFHTPTEYFLTDNFTTTVSYTFTDNTGTQNLQGLSPEGNFEYRVRTPYRTILSGAYLYKFGNLLGFLSAEVEQINYSKNSFNLSVADEISEEDLIVQDDLNNQIEREFANATNIRLGAEVALKKYSFRLGYNINGSKLQDGSNNSNVLSAGLGFRNKAFSLDLAFQRTMADEEYTPYLLTSISDEQVVRIDKAYNRVRLTMGIRFE